MAIPLKQSTASQEIPLGCFVDSTDGNTEENGLTIANTDIKLWKMGATTLASKNSGGATNISNGVYHATLDATDTDTLGSLIVFVHVAGALAVKQECVVLSANNYDSAIAATDNLQVDAIQFAGQTITAGAGVTMPATVASTTNITAGTITTVTNLTNAASAGDFTATMKTSIGTAVAASAVASVTGNVGGNVTGSVGSVAANGITASSLAADAGTEIGAAVIAAAAADPIHANIEEVNNVQIVGNGAGTPWGP